MNSEHFRKVAVEQLRPLPESHEPGKPRSRKYVPLEEAGRAEARGPGLCPGYRLIRRLTKARALLVTTTARMSSTGTGSSGTVGGLSVPNGEYLVLSSPAGAGVEHPRLPLPHRRATPLAAPCRFRFEWHQDGGRQNREIETDPRPRLSVKLGYWLCDVSEPGHGISRSSRAAIGLTRSPGRLAAASPGRPGGATELTASPGDAVVFDRRLWHARPDNYSCYTRKAMFFGYTFRWVAIRDQNDAVWSADLAGSAPSTGSCSAACQTPTATTRGVTTPRLPAARLAEAAQPARPGQPAAQAITCVSLSWRPTRAGCGKPLPAPTRGALRGETCYCHPARQEAPTRFVSPAGGTRTGDLPKEVVSGRP